MKKLNITFCSFPDFSSNAKPLYEYMKKRYKDTMNLVWIVKTDEMFKKLKEENIEVYKLGTAEYYKYVKQSDVFFTTHADITTEKSDKALYVELWHGISSKHVGFLSDNVNVFDKEWFSSIKRKIDYFVLPSDFWRVIFSTRFNVNYNRTINLGYPKLDYFIKSNPSKLLNKVISTDVSKYKKIIYYMPTFRKGCNREGDSNVNINNIFNIKSYTENKLIDFLEKNNYLLCIKKHPSEEINIEYIENDNIKLITDEALMNNNATINEIMNASDLLITDYSSLGIEYTFLNKPIIYLINDIEEYKKNRGITFGNYEFWMPGYKVNNINDLLDSISQSLNNNIFKNEILEKKKLWFDDLKDGGCKKICDFFFDESSKINKNVKYYIDYEEQLENKINSLNNILNKKQFIISEKDKELNLIKNSKGWKILEFIRRIKRKIMGR